MSCLSARRSVLLSACISAALTGRYSVKFYIWDFYENLLRKSKFGYSRAKISGTLHEEQSVFIFGNDIYRAIIVRMVAFPWQSFKYIFDQDICTSSIKGERIVAFPWQHRLCERATVLFFFYFRTRQVGALPTVVYFTTQWEKKKLICPTAIRFQNFWMKDFFNGKFA